MGAVVAKDICPVNHCRRQDVKFIKKNYSVGN